MCSCMLGPRSLLALIMQINWFYIAWNLSSYSNYVYIATKVKTLYISPKSKLASDREWVATNTTTHCELQQYKSQLHNKTITATAVIQILSLQQSYPCQNMFSKVSRCLLNTKLGVLDTNSSIKLFHGLIRVKLNGYTGQQNKQSDDNNNNQSSSQNKTSW